MDIATKSDNTDTIKTFSKKAYEIASKHQNIPLLIDCFNYLAYAYGTERKFDSAIVFYKRHYIIVSDDTSRSQDMARTLGNLGICYKNTDKYIDMWRSFRQSKTIFEKLQDTVKICWTTMEMGEAYEHFGMYQQAQELYTEALKLATKQNIASDIARCHYNIGDIILKENFETKTDSTAAMLTRARDYITKAVDESYNSDDIYADRQLRLAHRQRQRARAGEKRCENDTLLHVVQSFRNVVTAGDFPPFAYTIAPLSAMRKKYLGTTSTIWEPSKKKSA